MAAVHHPRVAKRGPHSDNVRVKLLHLGSVQRHIAEASDDLLLFMANKHGDGSELILELFASMSELLPPAERDLVEGLLFLRDVRSKVFNPGSLPRHTLEVVGDRSFLVADKGRRGKYLVLEPVLFSTSTSASASNFILPPEETNRIRDENASKIDGTYFATAAAMCVLALPSFIDICSGLPSSCRSLRVTSHRNGQNGRTVCKML